MWKCSIPYHSHTQKGPSCVTMDTSCPQLNAILVTQYGAISFLSSFKSVLYHFESAIYWFPVQISLYCPSEPFPSRLDLLPFCSTCMFALRYIVACTALPSHPGCSHLLEKRLLSDFSCNKQLRWNLPTNKRPVGAWKLSLPSCWCVLTSWSVP